MRRNYEVTFIIKRTVEVRALDEEEAIERAIDWYDNEFADEFDDIEVDCID